MPYNLYTTGMIAAEMLNDMKREGAKQRRWAQAMRARRDQAKARS